MQTSHDIFGFNARFDGIVGNLNSARKSRKISLLLGLLLAATLTTVVLIAGASELPKLSEGLTHYDRVQMLRLMDDINR